MIIEIDKHSGFCFGVVKAIKKAEELLKDAHQVFCLGDIVHNEHEVERLKQKGLVSIDNNVYKTLKNTTVLLRAHGEPPQTYNYAKENNISIVDATCPVVLRLQAKVKQAYLDMQKKGGQVVIYGKHGHAEIIGLQGQTDNNAIIISSIQELDSVDFSKPIVLFSQTTQNKQKYHQIIEEIKIRLNYLDEEKQSETEFQFYDTICNQVANRDVHLIEFSRRFDLILFVSGKKSSNGKYLFSVVQQSNPNTVFITGPEDITSSLVKNVEKIGICGATSTPIWVMEEIEKKIRDVVQ